MGMQCSGGSSIGVTESLVETRAATRLPQAADSAASPEALRSA